MSKRHEKLSELRTYIQEVDKEMTMLLQTLQWDRKHLEGTIMETCKYDSNHRVPPDKRHEHEEGCLLKSLGYTVEDKLLLDPLNPNSNTVIKLDSGKITEIIDNASKSDHQFKRGTGCKGPEPLTMERLQVTYTADERRAIYDAAVSMVPSQIVTTKMALPSSAGGESSSKSKSHMEVLAELRDMKRRRTKYRVAAKTKNYSDVLRDVIKAQMELYAEVHGQAIKHENDINTTDKLIIQDSIDYSENRHQLDKNLREEWMGKKRDTSHERHKEDRHREKRRISKDRSTYEDTEYYKEKRDKDRHVRDRKHDNEHSRNRSDKYYKNEINDRPDYKSKRDDESTYSSSRKRHHEKHTSRDKRYENRRDHSSRTEESQYKRYYDSTELPYEEKRRKYK